MPFTEYSIVQILLQCKNAFTQQHTGVQSCHVLQNIIPCCFGRSFWAGKKKGAAFCNPEDACGEYHQLCIATFDRFYSPSSMDCELL